MKKRLKRYLSALLVVLLLIAVLLEELAMMLGEFMEEYAHRPFSWVAETIMFLIEKLEK